jgi:hypothetical protein
MATTTDPRKFVSDIHKLAKVTEQRQALNLKRGADMTKELIYSSAAARGVKPTSNLAGKPWSVGYVIKGNPPTALVSIKGPFHLVESDTKAHQIYRRGARAKGRGSRAINRQTILNEVFGGTGAYTGGNLKLKDGGFRKVVRHPGTKGKGIFRAAKIQAAAVVPKLMAQSMVSGWRDALK